MDLRSRALCLAFVAAVSAAMHLKGITSPLLDYHYHRQCNTATIARNFHDNGLRLLQPQIDWDGPNRGRAATEFPLFMWLVGLLWPLAGLAELWGRVLAAAFSALTAVYLFLLVEGDLGREAALYSGTLFSFLPLEIYFGRTVQPEALALCATIAVLYHWRRALGPGRPWGHWAAATLAAFLAVSLKLPYVYLFAPMAWLAWERLGRAAWRDGRSWAGLLVPAGGVFAWYRYASSAGGYVVPTQAGAFYNLLDYGRLAYYVKFQFFSRFPELAATHMGLIPLLAGAFVLLRRERRMFYAVWFLSVAATLVAYGGYSFWHEYTSLPFVPVNAAFMGAGLRFLRDKAAGLPPRKRSWAWAGLALLVGSMPVYSAVRIRHWYRLNHPFLTQAAQVADRVSAPDDLFVCNERAPSVFLFHLRRRGWGVYFGDAGPKAVALVERGRQDGARFFATEKSGWFQDRDGEVARWFYARFPVVYDEGGLLIFRLR